MSLFEAAWVIARRDFVATVYSRSFILFLVIPLVVFGVVLVTSQMAEEAQRSASRPVVAVVADTATSQAVVASAARLGAGLPRNALPVLRVVDPAENVPVQARRLLADEAAGYSAVFSGTLERPVLTAPSKVEDAVARPMQLIVDDARRAGALDGAQVELEPMALHRDIIAAAAGNLQMIRRDLARGAMGVIFGISILLATLMLSNLAEEKSNKVIEVLAAAVPLEAVFLGKLFAMFAISFVGLAVWGGMLAIAYAFVQVIQDWVTLPDTGPAAGWPAFVLLVLIYYSTNYMLLGALFLGIGAQASNIRDIQTLSMPVTMLQVVVFLLAMSAVASDSAALAWTAYILPFSSPLAMVGYAAQYGELWPHLAAIVWQALWVVVIIRASSRLFRTTVLKSAPGSAFFSLGALFRPAKAK
ncbi:MAG TPA: ABC transporter permease [Allosphingosinicella sp.]